MSQPFSHTHQCHSSTPPPSDSLCNSFISNALKNFSLQMIRRSLIFPRLYSTAFMSKHLHTSPHPFTLLTRQSHSLKNFALCLSPGTLFARIKTANPTVKFGYPTSTLLSYLIPPTSPPLLQTLKIQNPFPIHLSQHFPLLPFFTSYASSGALL